MHVRMCARNFHSYTHLILTLGIVREPTVWGFITSEYLGIHDIGLPTTGSTKGSSIEIGQMDAAVSFLAWVRHSSSPAKSGKEWPHSVPGPVYCVRNWPAFVQTRAHHTVLQKRVLLVFVCSIQKQIKDMVVAWKLCVCSSIH